MNSAFTLCALVLGGWTMPDLGESILPPDRLEISREAAKREAARETRPKMPQTTAAPIRPLLNRRDKATMEGNRLMPNVPLPPTDPNSGLSPMIPMSPTTPMDPAAVPRASGNVRNSPAANGANAANAASGQRGSYQPFAPTQSTASAGRAPVAGVRSYHTPAAEGVKPFTGVRGSTGVTPWLNMYRPGGGGDNYNTLVRPELDQRATNQHVHGQIGGLQLQADRQGQQINQDTQVLQGTVNPQFFINYQQYFPGMGGAGGQ